MVGSELGTDPLKRGCGTRACSARRQLQGDHTATPGTYREVTEKMKPGCAQHCRVGGQEMTVYIETRGVQTGYREAFSPCEDSKWWDRLLGGSVQASFSEVLQTCLGQALSNVFWLHDFAQGIVEDPF